MIVRYASYLEASGYALSAIATIRALVNAGCVVEWVPLLRSGADVVLAQGDSLASSVRQLAERDETLADLPALMAATRVDTNAQERRTVVAQLTPEHLAFGLAFSRASAGDGVKRRIAYTTWETDRIPSHWLPLLRTADALVVPSRFNAAAFGTSGYAGPIHTIGHVRRHRFNEFSAAELSEVRQSFGLNEADTVFYTVNRFDPRKAIEPLVRAFAAAFTAADPVALVIKTTHVAHGPPPWYPTVDPTKEVARILQSCASDDGNAPIQPPKIRVITEGDGSGRNVDALHMIGDCYVSLTRGEGFGMGASEAATLGTPVIMTAWSGHMDFLGPTWLGGLPYRLEAAPVWPIAPPSYWSDQRWAVAEPAAAVDRMRQFFADPVPFRREAHAMQTRIGNDFSEAAIARKWREVLL